MCLTLILFGTTEIAHANFTLPPRLSANGYASNHAVAQTDLLLPLKADSTHNLYVDPSLSYASNNQGELDVGLGYRWIQNKTAILGGYLFGGYSRIDNNARLYVLNPGVEILASRWDAHLNVYFPMGDRHYDAGNSTGAPYFLGHTEQRSLFQADQFVGDGGDVKFSYQFFPNSSWKGYLGSYFFTPPQSENIWGGAAGLEYWLENYLKIIGSYTYDKLHHSTYAVGLGIEFGGTRIHRADPDIEERLTDPVARHLAELGEGSFIPARTNKQFLGTQVLRNNLAFFSQTGGPNNDGNGLILANCTYENPCGPTDFSQMGVNTLNNLLPNTRMYFNGGSYGTPQSDNVVELNLGQSIHSRTSDYSQAATGSARSTFKRELILNGNNTIENIILLAVGDPNNSTGINVAKGTNNQITGSQIGNANNRFSSGIQDSGQNTLLTNNNIFARDFGIEIQNASNSTFSNNQISLDGNTNPIGISINHGNSILIKNTQIQISIQKNTGGTGTSASGISASNSSVNIQGSVIQMQGGSSDGGTLTGVTASNSSTMAIENTQILVKPVTTTNLRGIETSEHAVVNANNITLDIMNSNLSGSTIALITTNSQIIINNSQLNAGGGTATEIVVPLDQGVTINNSICKINGNILNCPSH
ncbi:uncharacterized protein RVIR1_01000 [Candidatus Rickettsiella viridis]|uniref:Inverse autotransporter beta-domain domain-containing protein n=1 Tax=Candidatus Rickettsiella viridis TaxID=676208 RepID=A0A2Z5UUG6_9COXI|nr:right-handed parallel beta-helix repeat-containing protein [Candidatus Rickettsiella viridis]BBB14641.1 uncharacterized protein RVIR1_01000 [Candidatus Rickettsiella viridis]